MPPTWDPDQYRRFERERSLPVRDLIHRIADLAPRTVIDLGCGPGTSTRWLRQQWPAAHVTGFDSSKEMLQSARASDPDVVWELGDIQGWAPVAPYDLVFSNAALHWLPDHRRLLPRLFDHVAPGGALAFQMPANASHAHVRCIREVTGRPEWSGRLGAAAVPGEIEEPETYYRVLAPRAGAVEAWETTYLHVLDGPAELLEWVKGTALRPYLDALPDARERERFLADIGAALSAAYRPAPDGRLLFPFRRRFVVARR